MSERDYTVEELFAELKNDDSWESDPELRKMLAEALYATLQRSVG